MHVVAAGAGSLRVIVLGSLENLLVPPFFGFLLEPGNEGGLLVGVGMQDAVVLVPGEVVLWRVAHLPVHLSIEVWEGAEGAVGHLDTEILGVVLGAGGGVVVAVARVLQSGGRPKLHQLRN